MTQYLALDLGGTFIKHALIDDSFRILKEGKMPAESQSEVQLLCEMRTIEELYHGEYEGVAVSMPGCIDAEKGIARTGGSYMYMQDWPVREKFQEIFKAPVHVENDGKCAAMAELRLGSLKGVQNGVVLVIGTGIGGGLVLDGKVYKGSHDAGGELSFLVAEEEKFTMSSMDFKTRFSTLWCMQASTTGLLLNYACRKGIDLKKDQLSGVDFFKAYDQQDPDAKETLEHWGRHVAAGIFSLQSALDVERFALSGGISARSEVLEVVKRSVQEVLGEGNPLPVRCPEVVLATYGNQANVLGAVLFYLENDMQSMIEHRTVSGRAFLRPEKWLEEYHSDQELKKEQPPLFKKPLGTEVISLPVDFEHLCKDNDFLHVLSTRQSHRIYTQEEMDLAQLSFLLWTSQGVKEIRGKKYATLRMVPCGGARHEFECYMTIRNVKGLMDGYYHYLPQCHALELVRKEQPKDQIGAMLEGQVWADKANVVFFYSYLPKRTEWRYGFYGYRMVMADLGHVSENVYLAATALGLGGCAVGAVDMELCDTLFGLDGEEEFICYGFPVGTIKENDAQEKDFYAFVKEQGL